MTAILAFAEGTFADGATPDLTVPPYTTIPWSPAQITTGMFGWWDGADTLYQQFTGANLTYFWDKGGLGSAANMFPFATGPTRTYLNGLPALHYNNQGITNSAAYALNDFTVCVAFKPPPTGASAYERLIDSDVTTGWWIGRDGANAAWLGGIIEAGAPYGISVPLPNDRSVQIGMRRAGTAQSLLANGGGQVNRTVTAAATAVQKIALGTSSPGNGGPMVNGIIAETLVWYRALSDAELRKVEGYLAHKWGSADLLPANHPYKPSPPIAGYVGPVFRGFVSIQGRNVTLRKPTHYTLTTIPVPLTITPKNVDLDHGPPGGGVGAPGGFIVTSFAPGSPRNDFPGRVGIEVKTIVPTLIDRLGVWQTSDGGGNTGNHTVELYDGELPGNAPLLRTTTVNLTGKAPNAFYYNTITPITLAANKSYIIVRATTMNDGQWWPNEGVTTLITSFTFFRSAYNYRPSGTPDPSWGLGTFGTMYGGVDAGWPGAAGGNWPLTVTPGTFTFAGQSVTLTYTPRPFTHYKLTATPGALALSLKPATLRAGYRIVVQPSLPSTPSLAPAGATVHIDFIGGTAFVQGTGAVGIGTLVGNDPAFTGILTGYDPAFHTQWGYDVYANDGVAVLAFLGALRTAVVGGGSVIIKFQSRPDEGIGWDTEEFNLTIENVGPTRNFWIASDWEYLAAGWHTTLDQMEGVWTISPDGGVVNVLGFTLRASSKFEWAGNDRDIRSYPITNNDTPPANPMAASYMDAYGPVASITAYPYLTTAELKAKTAPVLDVIGGGDTTGQDGEFELDGRDVTLTYFSTGKRMEALPGTFALAGQPVALRAPPATLTAATGAFALSGQTVTLRKSDPVLTVLPGGLVLTGQPILLSKGRDVKLAAGTGSFVLDGRAATLARTYGLPLGTGVFNIPRISVGLHRSPAPVGWLEYGLRVDLPKW